MKPLKECDFEEFKIRVIQEIGNLRTEINDVRQYRDPSNTAGRIDNIFQMLDQQSNRMAGIMAKLGALAKEQPVVEFTDDNLKRLYVESGLGLKDIAMKFNTTTQNAHNYINGKIKDSKIRMELAIFCKEAKEKNDKKRLNNLQKE